MISDIFFFLLFFFRLSLGISSACYTHERRGPDRIKKCKKHSFSFYIRVLNFTSLSVPFMVYLFISLYIVFVFSCLFCLCVFNSNLVLLLCVQCNITISLFTLFIFISMTVMPHLSLFSSILYLNIRSVFDFLCLFALLDIFVFNCFLFWLLLATSYLSIVCYIFL
jgi:hypothetical protein